MSSRIGPRIAAVLSLILGASALATVPSYASTNRSISFYSPTSATTSAVMAVRGTLTNTPIGSTVAIRRRSGSSWVLAGYAKTTTGGAYSGKITMPSTRGTYYLDAYASRTSTRAVAVSATRTVIVRTLVHASLGASTTTPHNGAEVTLSGAVSPWVAGTGASLQRQIGSATTWTTVAGLTPDSTGHFSVLTTPVADSANRYRAVVATRGYFTGATSPIVTVNPQVPAPTGLTATPGSSNVSVGLRWNAIPASSNGQSLVIRRAAGTAPPSTPTSGTPVATLPASGVAYTDSTGLTPGAGYAYSLFLKDTAGAFSHPDTVLATAPNRPPTMTWSGPTVPQPVTGHPSYLRCPSTTFCMLLGDASYQTWNGASWTAAQPLPSITTGYGSRTCAAPSFCMWVGHNAAYTYNAGVWSGAIPVPALAPNDAPNSVSCTSPTFCITVTFDGNTELWNGSAWSVGPRFGQTNVGYGDSVWCASSSLCWTEGGDQWNGTGWSEVQNANGGGGFIEISCPSATFCVKADDIGRMSVYSSGVWSPMASPWPTAPQDNEVHIACPSSTFCLSSATATGDDAVVATWNGTSWTSPVTLHTAVRNPIIDCPTAASCMEVDSTRPHLNGQVTTYAAGTWGPTTEVTPANELQAVSCVAGGTCHTSDYAGNGRTFDGTTWGPTTMVDPAAGVTAISCGTDTFCAVVDDTGGAVVENNGSWGARQVVAANHAFRWLSCTSDSACMALTLDGVAYHYAGGVWAATSSAANTIGYIGCGSASYCVVGERWWNGSTWQTMPSNNGRVPSSATCVAPTSCVVSFVAPANGGTPAAAWFVDGAWASAPVVIGDPTASNSGEFPGVLACETPTLCLAPYGGRINEFTPTSYTDGVLQNAAYVPDYFYLPPSLSCTDTSLCVLVADGGVLIGRS